MDELTKEQASLLAALIEAGRAPDLDLIRACLQQKDGLTDGLLQILATDPFDAYGLDEDTDDARIYAPVHAGHLLVAFGERRAIPLFMEILRDPQRGKRLIEWFIAALHNYGQAIVEPLAELLRDGNAFPYGRAAATELLSKVGRLFDREREAAIAALVSALPSAEEVDGEAVEADETWSWIVVALGELRAEQALEQVRALFRADVVDQNIAGAFQDWREQLAEAAEPVRAFSVLDTYRFLQMQAKQEAQRQVERERQARRSVEHERIEPGGPTIRAEPKVGRNDPCPCGSGRKYKHCHGRPGSQAT